MFQLILIDLAAWSKCFTISLHSNAIVHITHILRVPVSTDFEHWRCLLKNNFISCLDIYRWGLHLNGDDSEIHSNKSSINSTEAVNQYFGNTCLPFLNSLWNTDTRNNLALSIFRENIEFHAQKKITCISEISAFVSKIPDEDILTEYPSTKIPISAKRKMMIKKLIKVLYFFILVFFSIFCFRSAMVLLTKAFCLQFKLH